VTTRIALDPTELRGAARLLQATASHLRATGRAFQREAGMMGGVTPAMQPYLGDALMGLSSRTTTLCDALEDDGLVLSAIASFIDGAEREGRGTTIDLALIEATYSAIELIGKHAEELGLHPAAVAALLPRGATVWDEAFASIDLPAAGKAAGALGWVIDGFQYYYESDGDWEETITRTVITGASGAAGGALGTAVCGLFGVAGGLPGLACLAVGGAVGGIGGDKLGGALYKERTLEDVIELSERVSKLPQPVQEQLIELIESGEYDVYEALRTIEMNFGHLDDPQIDDDPLG
jgi:hypothetical protein